MKGSVSIATLGCKTNQFESAALQQRLEQAGYRIVPFEAGADLVLVNTCTVTAATDSQSRNLVRRARRLNERCRVVVTGCYAQIDPAALKALPGVSLVLGNEEKRCLVELLEGSEEGVRVSDIRSVETATVPEIHSFTDRSRAFVQIQNGCDAFCSYCIIPYARGRSRSMLPAEVVAQVAGLVDAGYPEIVLTGIHIGGYGLDLQPTTTLLELLRLLISESGVTRLRLGSLEPTEIPEELIDEIAGSSILCPHLHIPLQAASDSVLQRMNRHYDTAFIRDLLDRAAKSIPDAAIGLDVIAGFPGESEAEFAATCELVETLPLSHLHVFPFSRRPGTPAATMPGQLPAALIKERAAHLRRLGERKQRVFNERFVGRELEVVVEGGGGDRRRRGLSRNYLAVGFAGPADLIGKLARVRVTGANGGALQGELL